MKNKKIFRRLISTITALSLAVCVLVSSVSAFTTTFDISGTTVPLYNTTSSSTYRYSKGFMSDFNDSNAQIEFRFSGIVPAYTSTGVVVMVVSVQEYIDGAWKGSPYSTGAGVSLGYNTQSYDLLTVSGKGSVKINLKAGSIYRFKYFVTTNHLSSSFELNPTCKITVNID